MGLSGNTGKLRPQDAPYPTGTPAELREMGLNLAEVHSCAVPKSDGNGVAIIRGCSYAKDKCPRLFDGRNPRIGDFAPKRDNPDSAGEGPEMVPFYLKTTEGDELESALPCHAFIASIYPRMLMARHPETPSGETIRILGKAGETTIVVTESLPVDPGNPKNVRMKDNTFAMVVQKHLRPKDLDARWAERQARNKADEVDTASDFGPQSEEAEIDVASDEPAPAAEPVAAGAASAEPVRRGKPRA